MAKKSAPKPKSTKKLEIDPFKELLAHEVKPREVVGGRTGKRFDFQYERASDACLELLETSEVSSIFCEWHDDFVVERKGNTVAKALYSFNQVKTRDLEQGPWTVWDIFGINKVVDTEEKTLKKSFVLKLFRHFSDFGKTCENIVIVTNNTIDSEFQLFLDDIYQINKSKKLAQASLVIFNKIYSDYKQAFQSLSESDLLSFLKKLHISSNESSIEKSTQILRTELADKIHRFSEIDLSRSETVDIMKDLIDLVRQKSQRKIINNLDGSKLREAKAVQIHEVLSLLSLSKIGYEALLKGAQPKTVLQLSRLQKFLKKTDPNMTETHIGMICELKASWESWHRKVRHEVKSQADMIALRSECFELSNGWSKGTIKFSDLPMSCHSIAEKYKGNFSDSEILSSELVFGCMLSLIVED